MTRKTTSQPYTEEAIGIARRAELADGEEAAPASLAVMMEGLPAGLRR
jgi:hypothetical protein